VGRRVVILLGQTEVDNIDLRSNPLTNAIAQSHPAYLVIALSNPHEEVVGLDVTVNKVARMYVFHAGGLWGRK
jgi:hypothetical protein